MSSENNHLSTNDTTPVPRAVTTWAPVWAICFVLAILTIIAGVVIASLVPVYLQTKDGGITEASSDSASRNIPMQFAINPPLSASQTPTNLAEIGQQISQSLGYPADTLSVRSSSVSGGADEKRKKRQTITVSPVCGANNSLSLSIYVNKCPNTACNTESCFQKCVVNIKIKIQLKLGTTALKLTIITANKTTTTILALFCSFVLPAATSTRATTTAAAAVLGCNDCYTAVITYYNGSGMFGDIVGTNINCATFCAGTFGNSSSLVGTDFAFGNVDFTRSAAAAIKYSHASGYTCRVSTAKPSGTCVTSYGDPNSQDGEFTISVYGGALVNCKTASSPYYYCCCQEKPAVVVPTTTTTTTQAPADCNNCKFTVPTYYNGGYTTGEIVGTEINCATFCAGTFGNSSTLAGTDFYFGNVDFTPIGTAAIAGSYTSGYTCRVNTTKPSGTCVTSYGDPTSDNGLFSIGTYGNITSCSSPYGNYYCCCQQKPTTDASRVWKLVGSMSGPRYEHAVSLLSNGKVLVIGGQNGSVYLKSAESYDSVTNIWTAIQSMNTARGAFTASLLLNGKVLVTGGFSNAYLNSAELYDLGSANWALTGNMNDQRYGHTASVLSNGKVLVTGGGNSISGLTSTELYDPTSGSWTIAANMTYGRIRHQAVVLSNGKVLAIGGSSSKSAELYDPSTNKWTLTGNMSAIRSYFTATKLSDGKVLVTGGDNNVAGVTAELYDPLTNKWTLTGNMNIARQVHIGLKLSNGKVLVAGGLNSNDLASSELYDPLTKNWTVAANMSVARTYHAGVVLMNGSALVAGGKGLASAEIY
ncbi:unnamed protein product [Adineta ricciae]|nr:unnamed protein product [Adineta ricciae]